MSTGQFERVTIVSEPTASGQIQVRNTLGKEQTVRCDFRAGGSAQPRPGELWIMWCPPGIPKYLMARIGNPAPPAVTGSRTGQSPLVLSLLSALAELGLIDDQSTA